MSPRGLMATPAFGGSATPSAQRPLHREGKVEEFAVKGLQDAVTSGAQPLAARQYAAAVVANALRRRIDSAGTALTTAATEDAEAGLAPLVERAGESIRDCAHRLAVLRG